MLPYSHVILACLSLLTRVFSQKVKRFIQFNEFVLPSCRDVIQIAHLTKPLESGIWEIFSILLAPEPEIGECIQFFRFNQSPNLQGGEWPYNLIGLTSPDPLLAGFVKFAEGVIVQDTFHEQIRGSNVDTSICAEKWLLHSRG